MFRTRASRPELRAAAPTQRPRSLRIIVYAGAVLTCAVVAIVVLRSGSAPGAAADSGGHEPAAKTASDTTAEAGLAPGMRKLSIDVPDADLVGQGDLVDIAATFTPEFAAAHLDGVPTIRLLRRVEVLGLTETGSGARVTISVAATDVAKLAFAKHNAELSLSGHPEGDDDDAGPPDAVPTPLPDPVTN